MTAMEPIKIDQKIKDLIRDKNTQLPTLPIIVDKILDTVGKDDTSAKDLAEFVSKDQAISNKILKLSNSAYYGMMKEIDSISRAITIIGFNEVVSLTIGMGVISAFQKKHLEGVLDLNDLWMHSISCGFASKLIAKRINLGMVEQIFLNGLLHDTGKVIFAIYFPDEYRHTLEEAERGQIDLYSSEKKILGIDHATLSGLLMEKWHFPDNLVLPSRYHHKPDMCPPKYQLPAYVIKMADYLCFKAEIGSSGTPVTPGMGVVKKKLGFDKDDISSCVDDLLEQRTKIEEFYKVIS
jgi:HD-like signal output (HDOD) protein